MTRTPEVKRATALLLRVAPDYADRLRNPVAYWDAVTSACDARTALSIALGKGIDAIDPARGTG